MSCCGGGRGTERVAFARFPALPPQVTAAKDILVHQAKRLAGAGGGGGGVRLGIEPDSMFPAGTSVEFVVESDRDGHFVILDIDARGRMMQIFPNEFGLRSGVPDWLGKGQAVRLPGV